MKEEIITFNKPWNINEQIEPSCFNGGVRVEKYKITIEIVEEPIGVICERLEKLWVESKNFHDYDPLMEVAKKFGYVFKDGFGSKNKQNER